MPMTLLSQASSYNPGADLWVIPEMPFSRSSKRMDWYLNFQLSRSLRHQPLHLAPELKKILQETNLPQQNSKDPSTGRWLISSKTLLPNRWVLMLQGAEDLPTWCESISQIWQDLRRPSLRLFLPAGLTVGEFQPLWKKIQSFDDFTVVLD